MIHELHLSGFKAFNKFSISFGDHAVLIGPNNAGKSTLIAGLRTSAQMVRLARARAANMSGRDGALNPPAYAFDAEQLGLVAENLRHEFRASETRLRVNFANKAELHAVWPELGEEDEEDSFYYLRAPSGSYAQSPAAVRGAFPEIGVVPLLSPVEREETILDRSYVRAQRSTRLSSRHFRNQLWLLQQSESESCANELEEFLRWAAPWTPDFSVVELRTRQAERGTAIDLYCREEGSRIDKELFWAGDGVQIWMQLLLHVFRLRQADSIVLDEPDVYLHADLQRRLVRMLESLDVQTIMATHSAEVILEASPESAIWVDKSRRRAVRSPKPALLSDVSAAIGTHFNLKLARALRARVVLFVEGKDMKLLRTIAKTIGASEIADEVHIAVVQLDGFSNWRQVEGFSWIASELLQESVSIFVILDRDYRSAVQVQSVEDRLKSFNVGCHIWKRKELESYLLVPRTIARISGAPDVDLEAALHDACSSLRGTIFARFLHERVQSERESSRHIVTITEQAQMDFDSAWASPVKRLAMAPAKDLLSSLNAWLTQNNYKPVSPRRIAMSMREDEVVPELSSVLLRVNALSMR